MLLLRSARVPCVLGGLLLALALPARSEEPPFSAHILPNGLTVLLSPSTAHPVIAVSAFVTTGGRTEDEYYQGSLHYIEHLVYKGNTPHLKPTEFRKKMSVLGREAGGWTWDDEINFGFEAPTSAFDEAFGIFQEALLDLKFEKDWFESEKRVVLQEMTTGREQPDEIVDEAWDAMAYDVHPYGRSVIGTEKAIDELDLEKTFRYYKDRFTPNHMILSVVGDFEPKEMLRKIEGTWGRLAKGPDSFELGLVEPPQLGPRSRTEYLPQSTSAVVLLGVVGPGGAHEDSPALEMLAALLNDRSVGLPQYLEEQEKWVTGVDAADYVMKDHSDFRVSVRTEPAKADVVTKFVERFLLDFDATKLPADVFEQARRSLLFAEAQARATDADRAERVGFLVSRRGVEKARALTERWAALTPEDVQAAKERWVQPRRFVTSTALPADFDPSTSQTRGPKMRRANVAKAPSLDAAGALLPAKAAPLSYRKTDDADGVSEYTYANGLRLLVRPTAASPLVAVSGRVLGGQWVEPPGQDGVNYFVAQMGLRATRRWDAEGFQALLRSRSVRATANISVGSRANTSRHVDYRDAAAHHYLARSEEWPTVLACLKETLFFPKFDAKEAAKLRDDLVTQARLLPENQLEYIKQEFYAKAYAGHPYGRATFGTEKSLAALGVPALEAFHRANWTPDRTVVSVIGDVDADTLAAWVSTRWADLGGAPKPPWSLEASTVDAPPPWNPPADTQVLALGKDLWTVNWGRPGSAMAGPEYFPSIVLARIAGNDHFYKYVYGEGVSYRSWINFWPHLGPGAWIVENDVKRERFDEIMGKFDEDLKRYATDGFSKKEFDDAVQRLVSSKILDQQDNAMTAWKLAVAEGDGVGFRAETEAVDRMRAVKFEETQALAKRVFAPGGMLKVVQK
jgi:zinc protease